MQHINSHILIILGLFLIFIETFLPAIGFLFAGIAAFITGCLTNSNIIDNNFYSQLACFLSISVLSAIILWIPLRKSFNKKNIIGSLVGEIAIIEENDLSHGMLGKAKWSNTIFNARLADDAEIKLKNSEVLILEIKGNILIVK